jgi:Zn-dependent alcohol dehydrogenase
MHLAKKLVTHIIKLEEINNGFSMMRNGEAGRIIINFEEGA